MPNETQTIDEITTHDGLVTRVTEVYTSHGELFLRTHQDAYGDGPVDMFHVHSDEAVRVARAILLAHGMLHPVPIARLVPIRSVAVGWQS